jgi:glycosyltransferase involved in cell wall biosynthesis
VPAERPHVLQLGPDMRGGMTEMIKGLLGSPLAERYELEMVATHRGPDPVPRRLAIFAAALWRLTWWSLRRRGRIVHVHVTVRGSMYRKAICVHLAKALRRRVVLHVHSGPGDIAAFRAHLGRASATLLRSTLRASDAVLAVSAASATALEAAYPVSGVIVVPNAAPTGIPAPPPRPAGRAPRVSYFGGFENPVKGGEVMLEAMRSFAMAGLVVTMAGPGELPEAGQRLVAEHDAVRWLGWLEGEDRDTLMRETDVFVLPSTSEGLPIALLEAMAYGRAIVATEVGGVPDVLTTERDALLVAPGDAAGLAQAIARLAADATLRERLGGAARERAQRLNAEEVTGRLAALYERLLGERA